MHLSAEKPTSVYASELRVRSGAATGRRLALENVSFALPLGSFTAILGTLGCGKSTLLRVMTGIQPLLSGELLLAGVPVRVLKQEWPLAISYLSAISRFHSRLYVGEILEHAGALRLPQSIRPRMVQNWLKKLADLTGLKSMCRMRIEDLTAAQASRVALAEALVGDPTFIFIDELTRGLDPFTDYEIMECLEKLSREFGKTIVMATQQLKSVASCDQVLFLHEGHCYFQGGYPQLLEIHETQSVRKLFGIYENALQRSEYGNSVSITADLPPRPRPHLVESEEPATAVRQFRALLLREILLLSRRWGWRRRGLLPFIAVAGLLVPAAIDNEMSPLSATELNWILVYLSLTLGLCHGSRAIAPEREILGKDLLAALSVRAFVAEKFVIMLAVSGSAALLLTALVDAAGLFQGNPLSLFISLAVTILAASALCLPFSAAARSPEQAIVWTLALFILELAIRTIVEETPIAAFAQLGLWNTLETARSVFAAGVPADRMRLDASTTASSFAIPWLLLQGMMGLFATVMIITWKKLTLGISISPLCGHIVVDG